MSAPLSKGMRSCTARLIQWLTFRMPLSAAMPVSVMKPIMEATESGWPAHHNAATEPISASGTEPMITRAKSTDR